MKVEQWIEQCVRARAGELATALVAKAEQWWARAAMLKRLEKAEDEYLSEQGDTMDMIEAAAEPAVLDGQGDEELAKLIDLETEMRGGLVGQARRITADALRVVLSVRRVLIERDLLPKLTLENAGPGLKAVLESARARQRKLARRDAVLGTPRALEQRTFIGQQEAAASADRMKDRLIDRPTHGPIVPRTDQPLMDSWGQEMLSRDALTKAPAVDEHPIPPLASQRALKGWATRRANATKRRRSRK